MQVLYLMIICFSCVRAGNNLTCDSGSRNQLRIFNGKETAKNAYPWTAYLSEGCGGAIITRYHVLTAAHCTYHTRPSSFRVHVGIHNIEGLVSTHKSAYRIARIVQHKGFNERMLTNDISILVLAKPLTFNQYVAPICMPNSPVNLEGKEIIATGWGETKNKDDDLVLREVKLKVINKKECIKKWPGITSSQICAYTPGKDTCNGDSGGGLFYLEPASRRYILVALVSFGPKKCGQKNVPSVNTNVYAFMDWIKKAVSDTQPGTKICTMKKK